MAPGPGDWWRPFRQFDDVNVTLVDLIANEVNEQAAWKWLDDDERARARRFQHVGARRRYVLCRASLRSLLSSTLECHNERLAFGVAEHGKPFATVNGQQVPINFNVSHSGRHGLIALSCRGRVGVDVEERVPQRNLDVLVEAILGPEERAEVTAASGRRRLHLFLDMWTMKEALSKAHGKGLSMDVSAFEIPRHLRNGSRSGEFWFADAPDDTWRLENIGTDRFAAAVAYE
jgi:4'-phosphopantetheinyl transferase